MKYRNSDLLRVVPNITMGASVAEQDDLLSDARVETSTFMDLLQDRVDIIPGTKGSGKSALYRIFVEFLPDFLLEYRKAVIAHGVKHHGDSVFHAFKEEFSALSENDFVDFWCIYVVSLVHEQFVKNERYKEHLKECEDELGALRSACANARIPEITAKKSLRDILKWTLEALKNLAPKTARVKFPEQEVEFEVDLFGHKSTPKTAAEEDGEPKLPQYMDSLRSSLEALLTKCGLSIWIMIDRLDEIFPRRSDVERLALRGLLRSIRIFSGPRIRMKVFLRDDMLDEVVGGGEGFTALTHVTARQADTLRWDEDQILTMVVKRFTANNSLVSFLNVDKDQIEASQEYRKEIFYKIFPPTVHKGANESTTIRWMFNHTSDGNSVVTPRDIIDLVTKAIQDRYNSLQANPSGESDSIIDSSSILYGFGELSHKKRRTYLEAEFPHLWKHIEKLIGTKAQFTEKELLKIFGKDGDKVIHDLCSIGLFFVSRSSGGAVYKIAYLYRICLNLPKAR